MATVLEFDDVSVVRNGTAIIDHLSWRVEDSERWVVLGPNGAGKSTLLQLAGAYLFPSSGTVRVLGEQLGQVEVLDLRTRIGHAATSLGKRLPAGESVGNIVLTAAYAVTGRWNEDYESVDLQRAAEVMEDWDLSHLAKRSYASLSDGEQKRVQIARAVMTDPELMLLDEPAGSLDLGAREGLVHSLAEYASSPLAPGVIMVTHHVEEIPAGFTHALLLADGTAKASGPIESVLTDGLLSSTFGTKLHVERRGARFTALAA